MRIMNILLMMGVWMGCFATVQAQSVDFLEDAGRQLEFERRPAPPDPTPVRPVAPVVAPAPTQAIEPALEPEPSSEKPASNHTFSFHGAIDMRFWMDNNFAWGLMMAGDKYFVGRNEEATYLSVGYDYNNALGLVMNVGWGAGRTIKGGIPTDFVTPIDDFSVDPHAGMAYFGTYFGAHLGAMYAYIDPIALAGANSPVGLKFTGGVLPHQSGMDSSHFMAGNYGALDFGFNTGDTIQSDALPGLLGFRTDMPVYFSTEGAPVVFSVLGGMGGFSEYSDPFVTPVARDGASKPWSVMAEVSSQGTTLKDVFAVDWNMYYSYYDAPSKVQDWNHKSTYLPVDRLNRDTHSLGFTLGTKAQDNSPFFIGMGLAFDYLILGSGLGWRTVKDAAGQVVYQPVWTSDLAAAGDPSVPQYEHRYNVGLGFSVGMDNIFSVHFAFNHEGHNNDRAFNRRNFLQVDDATGDESAPNAKQWLALRLNFDMIKNIQIYMGVAYGLAKESIAGTEYRPMSIDAGVEYRPLDNITLHMGWQMGSTEMGSIWAVEPSMQGAFYLRGRFSF